MDGGRGWLIKNEEKNRGKETKTFVEHLKMSVP